LLSSPNTAVVTSNKVGRRMRTMKNSKSGLAGNRKSNGQFVRPKNRCEDDTKRDLRGMSCECVD